MSTMWLTSVLFAALAGVVPPCPVDSLADDDQQTADIASGAGAEKAKTGEGYGKLTPGTVRIWDTNP